MSKPIAITIELDWLRHFKWGDHPLPNPPSNADNPTLTLDTDCQLSCWNPSTAGRSYGSGTYLKVPVFVGHARITPGNSFRGTSLGTLTMCSGLCSSRSHQSHQGSPPLFPMYLIPVAAPSSSTWITKRHEDTRCIVGGKWKGSYCRDNITPGAIGLCIVHDSRRPAVDGRGGSKRRLRQIGRFKEGA